MQPTLSDKATSPDRHKDLRKQLVADPNNAQALFELGRISMSKHEVGPAIGFFCQAVGADGKSSLYYSALGQALHLGGRHVEANCAFRQALALDSNCAEAYNGLGLALRATGDLELAVGSLRAAIKRAPANSDFRANLACMLIDKADYLRGYAAARKAHALNSSLQTARVYVAESLFGQGKATKAMKWLRKCIRTDPKWAEGYHNIGRALLLQGRFGAAKQYFRKVIKLIPEHADAHFGLAFSLLGDGKFVEGWKEYEWRFKLASHPSTAVGNFIAELSEPMWAGEDLSGKTLLVYGEQGFGDTFQSLRFLRELVKRGCRIILMVYKELVTLLGPMPEASVVIAYGQLIPRYDFHIPLFSLPRMLGTTIDSIPCDVPYLPIPKLKKKPAQLRKPAQCRVGFMWSTNRLNATDHRLNSIKVV